MTEELKRCWNALAVWSRLGKRLVLLAYYQMLEPRAAGGEVEAPVNTVKTWLRRSYDGHPGVLGL